MTKPPKKCSKPTCTAPDTTRSFRLDKTTKDGLDFVCRACRRIYHAQNKDKAKARHKRHQIRKSWAMLPKERCEKILQYARSTAIKSGYNNHADDFAQEYLIAIARGRSTSVYNHLTDYLRAFYGRNPNTRITEIPLFEKDAEAVDSVNQLERHNFIDQRIRGLKQTDRIAMILSIKYGLSVKEIGYCFGVSASRISQILKGALNDLGEG